MHKKTHAVALCRVSSLEQLQNNSLSHQRDNVLKAAAELGAKIPEDGIWSGHVSSKKGANFDRKDLREIYEYCKRHPNVKYLIVQEVDRFMRSPDEQMYFEVKFKQELGVKIWYADRPELNGDDNYAGFMRYMEGFRAAGSNDERYRKSINGLTKALQEGRYPFNPKPGYKKGVVRAVHEVHTLHGPILREILQGIATHQLTPSQALVRLNGSQFTNDRVPYKMDKFRKIITDPYYAGVVEIKKQIQLRNENGLHEPLITLQQHNELKRIMEGKPKTQSGPMKGGNPKYPLSNLVSCTECRSERYGRLVGFDHGNGKSKHLKYEKYRCRHCGTYITREELHNKVTRHLSQFVVSERTHNLLVSALAKVVRQQRSEADKELRSIDQRITSLQRLIREQTEAAIDPSNATIKAEILESIVDKKATIGKLADERETLAETTRTDEADFLSFALGFLSNMSEKYLELSKEDRLRCKQLLFPGGFYIDKEKNVYTPEISPLYRLAINKKDAEASDKALMVRVRRL